MAEFEQYGFFDSEITGYDDEGFPELDRAANSDLFATYYAQLVSDGVFADPSDCLQVIANNDMTVTIRPGAAYIQGRMGINENEMTLTLDDASTAYNRYTAVIARNNYTDRLMEIILRNGDEASSPEPPEIYQPSSGDYYEIRLANIYVGSNVSVITQSNITDTRYDSDECGVVTQLIDSIDTSSFFEQLNAFYEEYVANAQSSYEEFVANAESYLTSLQSYTATLQQTAEEQLAIYIENLTAYEAESEEAFTEWFESIKDQLSEDAAGNLQTEIDDLEERFETSVSYTDGVLYVVTEEVSG